MKVSSLAPLLVFAGVARAFFRMQCHSRLTLDQVDPIVNPGEVPATHVHTIMGGNNFHPSCNGTTLAQSTCTSCRVKGDGSAYWVPALYFQHQKKDKSYGKFELVEQVADMLVYYLPEREQALGKAVPFPPDFRMLAGDPRIRAYPSTVEPTEENRRQRAIGFNCMNFKKKAIGFLEVNKFPDRNVLDTCEDGLRAEIAFPNCWDGKNLDSKDHRSHVAYPENVQGGPCPKTHPVRIVSLLYETTWKVKDFRGKRGRFVWSHADATGAGYHGDFLNGWDQDLLKRVCEDPTCTDERMDGGNIDECKTFVDEDRLLSNEAMSECKIDAFVKGIDFKGPLDALPGCPKIEDGPGYAMGCHSSPSNPVNYGEMPKAPVQPKPKPVPPVKKEPAPPVYKAPAPAPAPVPAPAPAPAPAPVEKPPKKPQSKCANGKAPIRRGDPNVVWVTETVTETKSNAYAKRTAVPQHKHMHRKRHGSRH